MWEYMCVVLLVLCFVFSYLYYRLGYEAGNSDGLQRGEKVLKEYADMAYKMYRQDVERFPTKEAAEKRIGEIL